MMKKAFLLTLLALFALSCLYGEIRLPSLFSDGMILQREQDVKIWGWADPGEVVKVRLAGHRSRAKADEGGRWVMELPPMPAGGPYLLELEGRNSLIINDVYFGDLWICSGQSNMVLPMRRVRELYPSEPSGEGFPLIRHFALPTTPVLGDASEEMPRARWTRAIEGEVEGFSATAYFFAREIHSRYGIPIGLVNASVGGTPVQAWISEQGLESFSEFSEIIEKNSDGARIDSIVKALPPYPSSNPKAERGLNSEPRWYSPHLDENFWKTINIPGYWEDQGVRELDGVVWFRKEFELPASMTGKPALLYMGRIVDADEIWINGQSVGKTTYQYPPRRYALPEDLLQAGRNVIAIRVSNYSGKGGFVPDKPYVIRAGGQEADLKGSWKYRVGEVFVPGQFGMRNFQKQNQPCALYNGMIAPLKGIPAAGILWYQGESNAGNPEPYAAYLKALIRDWRRIWDNDELPFLYVQLANFMETNYLPEESDWAMLREGQRQVLELPNTAMAVAIDLGEWNDIHPLNKEDVGRRLALGAMHLVYGEEDQEWSGPVCKAARLEGDQVVLEFSHCDGGLELRGNEYPENFELAGSEGVFTRADASIRGNEIILRQSTGDSPLKVRYAWADNPGGGLIYNRQGLPASPFQMDLINSPD